MRHNSLTSPTMPMRLPPGNMHDIAHLQPLRLLALGANQARPHRHGQNLAALVRVPEGARSGREADVVAHAVVCGEDGVHVHCSCEGFGGLPGVGVGFVGAADELHFDLGFDWLL